MQSFTNVSADTRYVGYGLPAFRAVEPGQTVDVPDEVASAYDQPGIWERVAPASSRPAAPPPAAPAPAAVTPPSDAQQES